MAKDELLGIGALAVVFDFVFNSFDLILSVVDIVFPLVAVSSNYIAPEIAWMSEQFLSELLIVVAVLYIVHLGRKLYGRLRNDRS